MGLRKESESDNSLPAIVLSVGLALYLDWSIVRFLSKQWKLRRVEPKLDWSYILEWAHIITLVT